MKDGSGRFFKIFLYDFKMTLRQKEALFWLLLFPVLLMLIMGFLFSESGEIKLRIGVVDLDGSQVSRAVVEALEGVEALEVHTGGEEEEREALREGKRNGVVILHPGFGEQVISGETGRVTMVIDRSEVSTAQVTSSTLRGILEKIGGVMPGAPEVIEVNEEEEEDVKGFKYIDFLVPGILAMVIMFSGLTGYALEVATYREKGILRRVKVSPVSLTTFLGGGIASVLFFSLLQAAVLLAFGALVFKVKVSGDYVDVAVLVLLGTLSFLAVGFLIASLTRNSRSAGLAAQAIGLPMMFLAGIFYPVQFAPAPLKVIARCLPLYYLGDGLREVMINSASLAGVWLDLLVLAGMGIAAFVASAAFFRWE